MTCPMKRCATAGWKIRTGSSSHAREVEYIGKGKARQAYAFGVKVGIAVTACKGLVVGARSFPGNPYDGDTLAE